MALVLQLMLLLPRHLMMSLALQKRNRKLVIAVPVVWERRVEEIRVVVVGIKEAVILEVVVVVAVDKVASMVVIAMAGMVVALAVAGVGSAVVVAATLRVPAVLL